MKKTKYSALVAAMAISASLAVSSCADMLQPESDLLMYPEDNRIDTPYDTVYSVVGILHLMEKVVDRTFLLGEVRSDLVSLTGSASKDLQELASSTISVDNAYNNPQDYYAIINNCNYYIANADSTYKKQGVKVFERELSAVHSMRAWTYLQLALNYGEIPFYLDFLDSQLEAEEVMRQPKRSVKEICSVLAEDLLPFAYTKPLVYGKTQFYFPMNDLYIPVKLMLAEMYLWAEKYDDAIFWYHEYLTDKDDPRIVGTYAAARLYNNGVYTQSYQYSPNSGFYLVCNNDAMYGNYSQLNNIFNSTSENNYFYEVTVSEAAYERSDAQRIVIVATTDNMKRDTIEFPQDLFSEMGRRGLNGDLRIASQYRLLASSTSNDKMNKQYQTVSKLSNTSGGSDYAYYYYYRNSTVYLHFAEALNRAGYPTAAFAILKYGLCEDNTTDRPGGNPIAADEVERAGDILYFSPLYFKGADYSTVARSRLDNNGTIVISEGTNSVSPNTMGIHCFGGTAADADTTYVIPVLATREDTTLWVEDKIVEELALETIFEGQRFYDLMRVALRRNDNSYLADPVAARDGSANVNEDLRTRLMDRHNWYLPFQK